MPRHILFYLTAGGQKAGKNVQAVFWKQGNNPPFHFISCAEGNSGSRMRAGIAVDGKGQSRIWGDRIVIDWKEEAEKTYGFRVDVLRRGRGSWILETDLGLRLLKEYRGSVNRLEFEEAVLQSLDGMDTLKADQYVRNSEGELLSTAEDGTRYIVKEWFADQECDLKDEREVLSAVRALALLHRQFRMIKRQETWNMRSMISLPLFEAMRRHNRELKKARTFIRGKRKKNEFELRVIGNFEIFAAQAVEAERGMERLYEIHGKEIADGYAVCHGEPDYHHILIGNGYTAVTEFNQMHLGVQMEDLYYFLRKVLEKSGWKIRLGDGMLNAYSAIHPLTEGEMEYLKIRLIYPEKFWKTANSYYCTNKAWISVKNIEKLQTAIRQTEEKKMFLKEVFGFEL